MSAAPKSVNFNSSLSDERLLTKKGECWVVDKIIHEKTQIYLDPCHSIYKLCFNNKLRYKQSLGGAVVCETTIDNDEIRKEDFLRYWENEVRHLILFQAGNWKTKENILYLTDKNGDRVKYISYIIDEGKLILEPTQNYKIMLIKKPAINKSN